jgi:hypothetical protein
MIEGHFEEHTELFAQHEIEEILREANRISDAEFDEVAAGIFRGRKTAAEFVSDQRERS